MSQFFLNAHTWGLNSAYAVFLAYYIKTNTFQASDVGYAFIGGLSLSVAFLISPLATFLAGSKKFGTRWTIFTGNLFETIGFLGSSFATQLWHIVLTQGIAFGIGMGLCFVASAPIAAQWFHKKRSLANGLATAGSGFGGLIYSLGTNAMIEHMGLAWTFRALAIICFVVNGVASFFIRDRNTAIGSVTIALNWKLFRRPCFILYLLWMTLSIIGYVILVFSIVAYCQAIGLSASQASLVGALFNLGQGIGRPAVGLCSDSVGRFNIAMLGTLCNGLLCLFLWMFAARSFAGSVVYALVGGSVAGVMWPSASPICAEVVGIALIPSALSITWLVFVIPVTFAEVIGLSLRSAGTWGYRDVQLFTAFMFIGSFIFGWILRAWKVRELIEKERLAEEEQSELDGRKLTSQSSRTSAVTKKGSILRELWAVRRV
ncbi:major facilitator superfamily domain-containing protein [Xylaria nigripes]|nr:major facilitator superfamily domain-containing protein [Xylaria nigripes]